VAAEVGARRPPGVSVAVTGGEPAELIEAWSDADLAIVVDALRCASPRPGRIHRTVFDGCVPWASAAGSAGSHGLGLPDALRLAEALGRAPRQLVVYAVEGAEFGFGAELSEPVSRAVPEVVRAVLAEVATAVAGAASPAH
jgi:hydrogenase maturation protease